jgi:hypothetical protein
LKKNEYNTLYYGFEKIIPPSKVSIPNMKDKTYSTLWLIISYMGANLFDVLEMTSLNNDFIDYKNKIKGVETDDSLFE